jgi:hypothetical protein
LDVDVVAADGSAPHALDAAASRRKSQPPRLEEFHAIRGLVLGSVADSLAAPQKKPPPASTVQFQLATPENRFHVLAARCDARSDEGDFGIRVGAGGLVYVHKRAGRSQRVDGFVRVRRALSRTRRRGLGAIRRQRRRVVRRLRTGGRRVVAGTRIVT